MTPGEREVGYTRDSGNHSTEGPGGERRGGSIKETEKEDSERQGERLAAQEPRRKNILEHRK